MGRRQNMAMRWDASPPNAEHKIIRARRRTKIREMAIILSFTALFIPLLSVNGSQEFRITTDRHSQCFPAIYGDIVVWEDDRNGNDDIYGYDLSTSTEFQITTDTDDQWSPTIYGNIVVWADERKGGGIYGYNLSTKEEFMISDNVSLRSDPIIYDNIVVWENGPPDHVFGYNLVTGEEFQITAAEQGNEVERRNPAIYKDIVIWEEERSDRDVIYGYRLSTGEEFQVCPNLFSLFEFGQNNPAIYGDTVVWTEGLENVLYAYNMSTGEKTRIGTADMDECSLPGRVVYVGSETIAIYGDIVVWVDCRNDNEDIYGYNLSTDEEFQITTDLHYQIAPSIYGDVVVWADERHGNWDIFGYDLSSPLSVVSFTSRTRLLLLDIFSIVLTLVPVPVMGLMVRTVIIQRKCPYKTESAGQSFDFRRSIPPLLWFLILLPVVGILISGFNREGLMTVGLLAAVYVFAGVVQFWARTPYIRIKEGEIMIFPVLAYNPKVIKFTTIQRADFKKDRIELLLSNNETVRITLSSVREGEDREDLVRVMRRNTRNL